MMEYYIQSYILPNGFFASNIFIISLFKSVHSDVNLKLMHGQILIEEKAWIWIGTVREYDIWAHSINIL